ncbi:MAG: DUF4347 domain-containing protein [Cyanobacteria bacterium J06626_18]
MPQLIPVSDRHIVMGCLNGRNAAAAIAPQVTDREIAIFDPRIDAIDLLVAGLRPAIKAIVLQEDRPGLQQIDEILKRNSGIRAIHVIAHGQAGRLQLGSTWVDEDTLEQHRPMLNRWREFLSDEADLLLYGCQVAAGDIGQAFIAAWQQHTGARIAASRHRVGNQALGGTWELDVQMGTISTAPAFGATTQAAYPGVFVSFEETLFLPIGADPSSTTVGNFNNDGALDIAVVNAEDNTVSILLGDGSGGFGGPTTFAVGNVDDAPGAIVAGSFNGDDNTDLAIANFFDNTISVLLGDGTGSFSPPTSFAAGNAPTALQAADFNGDGNLDLVSTATADDAVLLLLGDGTGGFGNPTPFAVGDVPTALAVDDFDGDGSADIAVANFSEQTDPVVGTSDTLSILLGDGAGSFAEQVTFEVGIDPVAIVSGDFDEDDIPDLAVSNFFDSTVSVLLGDGTGSFGSQTVLAVEDAPRSLVTADFNGDGDSDLVVGNIDDESLSILEGNGQGNFADQEVFELSGDLSSINAGDFDGDGDPDLIATNGASTSGGTANTVSVVVNTTSDGVFEFTTDGFPESAQTVVAVAGDTTIPLITLVGDASGVPEALGNTFLGSFEEEPLTDELGFQFQGVNDNTTTALTVEGDITGGNFTLVGSDTTIAVAPAGASEPLLSDTFDVGSESLEGIDLADLANETGIITVEVEATLFREAAFDNLLGFYLADKATGDVIDPLTGAIVGTLAGPGPAYLEAVRANTLVEGQVDNGETAALADNTFEINADLALENYALLPFLDAEGDGDLSTTYVTSPGINADNTDHVQLLGQNTWGFEDLPSGGDNDFDDMVVEISNLRVV